MNGRRSVIIVLDTLDCERLMWSKSSVTMNQILLDGMGDFPSKRTLKRSAARLLWIVALWH